MKIEEKQEQRSRIFKRALITGLVGGLLASLFSVFLYTFNFAEIAPKSYLLKPWIQTGWTDTWLGHIIASILSSLLSIIPAILYFFLFRKKNSLWVAALFGVILWGVLFFIIHPLIPFSTPLSELTMDTHVTTLCVFILYGTFIGYSISYDYHDVIIKMEKQKSES